MKRVVKVYRSARHEGMHLIVPAQNGFERVPAALLERFGKPVESMTMVLTPERRLARTHGASVLAALDAEGFYLQLPPGGNDEMAAVAQRNDKLWR